jgi:hypothetical protein
VVSECALCARICRAAASEVIDNKAS